MREVVRRFVSVRSHVHCVFRGTVEPAGTGWLVRGVRSQHSLLSVAFERMRHLRSDTGRRERR